MYKAVHDGEKIARYRAFWRRAETDRPLIGTTIATMPSVRAIRGEGILSPTDLDLVEGIKELDESWEQWREWGGDAMWSASPLWAFPWQSAMIGCPIEREGDNVWQHHVPGDWSEMERVRFDPANPWFQRLAEFTAKLKEHAAGRYPVGAGLLGATPSDLMMIFRGQERFAVDMYDSPALVVTLAERSVQFCVDAMAHIMALVPTYHGGWTGTIRYFWAPEPMLETGEDLAFMMSPAAHKRFVVPIHRAFCRHYPCNILHLHSAQLHTVPNLLE
ncbi:MAG: uroporphyrinogen decarboxylase/cobalamine-independent methonine synthase family protein, partial [Chloroflexota bacterium]